MVMKNILLSAESSLVVYHVPSIVADNLEQYCVKFCNEWLQESPDAEKYRIANGFISYDERDFIEYLNTWLFKEEHCELEETLDGVYDKSSPSNPEKYRRCSWFNF